jgi:hypothetical protein
VVQPPHRVGERRCWSDPRRIPRVDHRAAVSGDARAEWAERREFEAWRRRRQEGAYADTTSPSKAEMAEQQQVAARAAERAAQLHERVVTVRQARAMARWDRERGRATGDQAAGRGRHFDKSRGDPASLQRRGGCRGHRGRGAKRQPQRGCPLANPKLRRRARWAAASTRAFSAGGGKPVGLLQSSRESCRRRY